MFDRKTIGAGDRSEADGGGGLAGLFRLCLGPWATGVTGHESGWRLVCKRYPSAEVEGAVINPG